jgi:hypothetical protein
VDAVTRWVGQLIDLGNHYPDLLALLAGSLIGYTFTVMFEAYFLPVTTVPAELRRQKQVTIIVCWLVAGAASAILWVFLDPRDPPSMRITVSYLVAILAFPGYPFLAKLATSVWPKVGSAWSKRE